MNLQMLKNEASRNCYKCREVNVSDWLQADNTADDFIKKQTYYTVHLRLNT
jgi:hypothetical protein